jgi:hypothetical protein
VILKPGRLRADDPGMSGPAGYDPKIIERFAEQLLRKADSVRVGMAVGGGIFGTIVGSVPLTPLQSVWPIPGSFGVATILLGALIGILVGYVIGEGRAFRYRVEAQRALFQLDIEKRVTAAVVGAVDRLAAQVQASNPAPPAAVPPPPAPAPPLAAAATPAPPALRPPGSPADEPELPPLSPAASA